MSWGVFPVEDPRARHVIPVDDEGYAACGHEVRVDCPACQPKLLRDGPLDDPVWSHQQPDWPGANDYRLDA